MSERSYRQMIEDVCEWGRAGYPMVAIGRYQDAAEEIMRLRAQVATFRQAERVRSRLNAAMAYTDGRGRDITDLVEPDLSTGRPTAATKQPVK